MPAFNEAQGIRAVVEGFRALPEVVEVIVADNGSTDGTQAIAQGAGAIVVHEGRKGYGFASQKALMSASAEWVAIVESDGTFSPHDVYKFLPYAQDFDVIFGSRTSKALIWEGANMGHLLRLGNVVAAKYLEYLHNGPCLTDVGCTFKLLRASVIRDIAPHFTVGGSAFSPELMFLSMRKGWKCVEIPVTYGERTGTSKITGDTKKAAKLGAEMLWKITTWRFRSLS